MNSFPSRRCRSRKRVESGVTRRFLSEVYLRFGNTDTATTVPDATVTDATVRATTVTDARRSMVNSMARDGLFAFHPGLRPEVEKELRRRLCRSLPAFARRTALSAVTMFA
jgi:hypothetical protein